MLKIIPVLVIILNLSPVSALAKNPKSEKAADYGAITRRNIFWPLWKTSQKTPEEIEAEKRRAEELRIAEQDKKWADLRQQEAARAEEAMKNQILNQVLNTLVLTGIVNDGNQLIALVQNRRQGNKTVIIKKGDTIEEFVVTDIDQANSTVMLEYQNKFKTTLTLKNP